MALSVDQLLHQHPARLWRAREQGGSATSIPPGLPTGYEALDCCLPGQGWPRQGLIEILSDHRGIGELGLLMPALARLCGPRAVVTRKQGRPAASGGQGGWIAWVSPPYVPYAP